MSVIDVRPSDALMQGLLARLPAFVPDWQPAAGGAGEALLWVYAEFLHALSERIAMAPDKNELAFLDLLGLDVLPAQGARAPVVFTALPGGGDGLAPAGTRLNAKGPDPSQPLVFETERAVTLTRARVADVVSLWPGRDAYADHSDAVLGGRPFTLWSGLQPVAHELYLAHDLHFALSGVSSVGIDLELAPAGSEQLQLEWSWWDGRRWCAFKDFQQDDESGWSPAGTRGPPGWGRGRRGRDCAASVRQAIGGFEAHWLRARSARALPPDATRTLAQIDRVSLKTVIDRRLPASSCDSGLDPDSAFAGGEQLDTSKAFFPLGKAPSPDIAFYLACGDAFSRPHAQAEICFERAQTEQEKLDGEIEQFGDDVTSAVRHVIDSAKQQSLAVQKIAEAIIGMAPANDSGAATASGLKDALKTATDSLADMSGLDGVAGAAKALADALPNVSITLPLLPTTVVDEDASKNRIQAAADDAAAAVKQASDNIVTWGDVFADLASLLGGILGALFFQGYDQFQKTEAAAKAVIDAATAIKDLGDPSIGPLIQALQNDVDNTRPDKFGDDSQAIVDQINQGYSVDLVYKQDTIADILGLGQGRQTARDRDVDAADAGEQALIELAKLSPLEAAGAAGKTPPDLGRPVLAWEYWNGSAWRELVSDASDDAANLRASGRISFEVPGDWEQSKVAGTDGLWLRARIVSGVFGKLTLVSWKDQDHEVHYLPIVEPRPPRLDALKVGYYWESKPSPPQHALTHNDFAWEDHTGDAAWRGGTFPPFRPVADSVPALYVGFDGALPAGELGLLADVEEVVGDERGPALVWESFDGASWNALSVEDETDGLAVPGIVHIPYPGSEPQLPRFGTPRSWVRARLRSDGDPRRSTLDGLHGNAVWAAQVETVAGEALGSSTGEPSQAFFLNRTPVLAGEVIEVRELEGGRAHVEYPLLVAELAAAGIAESELGVERDPRTGKETAVWVPWRGRPNLGFSGPADRHYTIERTRGRVEFGDGVHGRIPVAARDNIRARRYRSSQAGSAGNVPAGAITQVTSGLLVAGVTNPLAAEGGAASEPDQALLERGPLTIRNRRQAVTAGDYEALALEASPAVAVARAATRRGAVTVTVLPYSPDPQPYPGWQLRRAVEDFLRPRMPAAAGSLSVVPPKYFEVGVSAVVVPRVADEGGVVAAAAQAALAAFLHPLTGGPGGRGWPFGRSVYLSDVAGLIEGLQGVDHAAELSLLVAGAPAGEVVAVPSDRLVAAGLLDVTLGGPS